MTSIETPASFGVHGPGEITILSGLRVSISPIVIYHYGIHAHLRQVHQNIERGYM